MEIDSIDIARSQQLQKRKKSAGIFNPTNYEIDSANELDGKDGRSDLISSPDTPPSVYFGPRLTLANRTCWYMGFALIGIGIVGFAAPRVWEFHFGVIHSAMNLIAGIVTMWVGLTKKGPVAKSLATWLGLAYLLFGLAGFIFGMNVISNGAVEARYFMTWIPGAAEFGRWDHYLHMATGFFLFVGGVLSRHRIRNATSRVFRPQP